MYVARGRFGDPKSPQLHVSTTIPHFILSPKFPLGRLYLAHIVGRPTMGRVQAKSGQKGKMLYIESFVFWIYNKEGRGIFEICR